MKFAIISGSHRKNSESARVGAFMEARLKSLFPGSNSYFLNLGETPLPLWDEGIWTGAENWKTIWAPISKELQSSDAVIVISPEWSGMVPAALKNFFLLCGNQDLGHKPGLIVAVSSSRGGAYPVAELRMSSYKNTSLCYIPDHIIARDVTLMLKSDTPVNQDDEFLRQKIDYSLKMLNEYGKALKNVRESGVPDFKNFPYGM